MYAAVKRNGIHLGMLLPMRFDPPYLAMRRIVQSGAIGEVLQIDAQKSYQLGERPAWQKHAATYGSTILWIAIHSIDLMLWVSGRRFTEAASLQSHVGFPEAGDMQNVTGTLFRLDNGGSATLHMDYLRPATASGHGDDRLRVERVARHRRIPGEYRRDADDGDIAAPAGRARSACVSNPSLWIICRACTREPGAALSWAEIVRANEATLAAHTAAGQHRFVAIPQVDPAR